CLVWLAACARPTPLPCCRLHGETAAPSSASAPLLERPRPTLPRPGRVSGIPPERPPLPLRGGGLRRRGAKRVRAVQRTDTSLQSRTICFLLILRASVVSKNLLGAFSPSGHSARSQRGSCSATVRPSSSATLTRTKQKRELSLALV